MQFADKILNSVIHSSGVVGIELFFGEDGAILLNYSELSKKKDSISIVSSQSNVEFDLKVLKEIIPSKLPVVLVINGKGIVHKKITHASGDNEKAIFQQAFSNIKEDDFCVQQTYIDNTHSFLSLARRDMVTELLNQFKTGGLSVIGLYLGVFPLNFVLPLIEKEMFEGNIVRIRNSEIELKDAYINSIKVLNETQSSDTFQIADQRIETEGVISYSAALSYFTNTHSLLKMEMNEINILAQDFKDKRLFQTSGKLMLGFFISVLMVNYFFFNYYFTKKNMLTEQISSQIETINRVDTLKAELQKKRSFLNKSGFLAASRTSFYADRIASGVPDGILLDELNIEPLQKKQESDTSSIMSFDQGVILISGVSKSSVYVGDWMKVIKSNDWVKSAELLSYDQDKELNQGKFNIQVNLKH